MEELAAALQALYEADPNNWVEDPDEEGRTYYVGPVVGEVE